MFRKAITLILILSALEHVQGQVFMPQPATGAMLGIGQAGVAIPHQNLGLSHAAQLGFMEAKAVAFAGTALPFGLTDWQVATLDAAFKAGKRDAFGVSLITNRVPQYSESAAGLSYGRSISPKLSVGATLGYQLVQAGEYGNAGAPMIRISAIQKLLPTLSVGAAISNPAQQKLRNIPQNSLIQLGLFWKASKSFECMFEVTKEVKRDPVYRGGLVYYATERLMVLGGISTGSFAKASLGFGLKVAKSLRMDVSGSWHPILGITPGAGLRFEREGQKQKK